MTLKCWIISLTQDQAVVQTLKSALARQGISAGIYPAVDGRITMPALRVGEKIDQTLARCKRRATLTKSEVGCYLSHYRVIKDAYDQGAEHLCIFEDDVAAEEGIGDAIREITTLPPEYELVRLMSLRIRRRKVVCNLSCGLRLVRPLRGASGTQGYVINRRGMEKVIRKGGVMSKPIDKLYDHFWDIDLKCFSTEPHMVYEVGNESTIVKPKKRDLDKTPWVLVAWQAGKVVKSFKRYSYFIRHWREFIPAQLPEHKPGRTARMR